MEEMIPRSVKLEPWLWNALYHWGAKDERSPGWILRVMLKEACAKKIGIPVKDLERKLREMPVFPVKPRKKRARDISKQRSEKAAPAALKARAGQP